MEKRMNNKEYKLSTINKVQITASARRSLIAADSNYYSWSPEKQEEFRVTMSEKARQKIAKILLSSLLNIQCGLEETDEVWEEQPLNNLNMLNWASLLTNGIGEDFITLNEFMAKDKTLLDFTTLFDYDHADYLYQEQARKKESKDYQGADYYPFRWAPWVRLLIDENFWYSSFTSIATHLNDDIEEAGNDYINTLIPHEYVEGENHGKQEKGGVRWDMKKDASGRERQLEELQHRWHPYLQDCWLAISNHNADLELAVYTQDFDWDNDPHRCFIFRNEATLKKVRWRHFLSDIKPLIADYSIIEKQLEKEIEKAKAFLEEQYQDIMENFDPDVIKLRKKMKIVISPGALEGLGGIDSDDE